jgi:hypothetical protein
MRRRSIAILGAILFSLAASSTALAWPPGTVSVATDGCSFTIHIDLESQTDVVGWSVNASTDATWDSGTTVLRGSGSTDSDGVLDLGPFSADAGEYNVVVDDESRVDASSIVEHFLLSCEAPVASGPVASAPPATGSELPAAGSPPPTGEELGLTGAGALTPPPTDVNVTAPAGSPIGFWAALIGIGAITVSTLLLSRRLGSGRLTRGRRS